MVKSCYIHIPFCEKICSYCDFCKIFYNKEIVDKYLDILDSEIKEKYKGDELSTIYIGGGTPSCLSYQQLEKLLTILNQLKKAKDIEYTIECNFSSITEDKLLLMKKYGINRLSFGIESISQKNLLVLERNEDKKKIKDIILIARKIGFSNINVDLMYAISNETLEELTNDLLFILSLDVEHISTYSLILEKNTKLFLRNIKPIDEELDFLMYNTICDTLKKRYKHYEISNFAKEGFFSLHNLCYWHNEEYYGFGVSAASYLGNFRKTNTKSITKYLNKDWNYASEVVNLNDKMSYEMILGLRLLEGVSKDIFFKKYNQKIEDVFNIENLKQRNLIEENDKYYYINEKNLYISNEILINFIKE